MWPHCPYQSWSYSLREEAFSWGFPLVPVPPWLQGNLLPPSSLCCRTAEAGEHYLDLLAVLQEGPRHQVRICQGPGGGDWACETLWEPRPLDPAGWLLFSPALTSPQMPPFTSAGTGALACSGHPKAPEQGSKCTEGLSCRQGREGSPTQSTWTWSSCGVKGRCQGAEASPPKGHGTALQCTSMWSEQCERSARAGSALSGVMLPGPWLCFLAVFPAWLRKPQLHS